MRQATLATKDYLSHYRREKAGCPSFPRCLRKGWDSTRYPFPCFGPRDKCHGTTWAFYPRWAQRIEGCEVVP